MQATSMDCEGRKGREGKITESFWRKNIKNPATELKFHNSFYFTQKTPWGGLLGKKSYSKVPPLFWF